MSLSTECSAALLTFTVGSLVSRHSAIQEAVHCILRKGKICSTAFQTDLTADEIDY